MVIAHLIDEQGVMVSPITINMGQFSHKGMLPKGVILTPIPEAMNRPRWTGKKWVDSKPDKRFIFWKTKK